MATEGITARGSVSLFTIGTYLFVGGLLAIGQLVPSSTLQVASGESLPQVLLWLVAAALLATGHTLELVLRKKSVGSSSSAVFSSPSHRWLWPIFGGIVWSLWLFLAILHVAGNANMRWAINSGWQWLILLVAILVLYRVMISPLAGRLVLSLMIGLAAISALHGAYQILISLPADRLRFRDDPQGVLREAGIEAAPGSSTYLLFQSRLEESMATGPFALANSLAGFLLVWSIVLFAYVIDERAWRSKHRWKPAFASMTLVGLGLCLVWTQSRSGWMSFILASGLVMILQPALRRGYRRQWARFFPLAFLPWAFLTSLLLLILLVFLFREPFRKALASATQSLTYRWEYWENTLRMAYDAPWFGFGPGNFQAYYAHYKPSLQSETVSDPHQFLLETLAAAGWPSLLLLLMLLGWLCRQVFSKLLSLHQGAHGGAIDERKAASRSERKACGAIYLGGLGGAALVWLANGGLGTMPDAQPYIWGGPLLAVFGLVDFFFVMQSDEVERSPLVSVIGMAAGLFGLLLHLSFSGGWMTPGISTSMAVLVAGLLVELSPFHRRSSGDEHERPPGTLNWLPVAGAGQGKPLLASSLISIGVWGLLIAFYATAWFPAQESLAVQAEIRREGLTEAKARRLIAADPKNPLGYRWLAEVHAAQAEREGQAGGPAAATLTRFDEAAQAFVASDRAQWESWAQLGHWEIQLSQFVRERQRRALQDYREASQRSPGDLGLLLQVAWAAWLVEDRATMRDYLARIEQIESTIVHLDRRLAHAVMYWPIHVGPPSTRVKPSVWQGVRDTDQLSPGWVRAEPVYQFLRSQP